MSKSCPLTLSRVRLVSDAVAVPPRGPDAGAAGVALANAVDAADGGVLRKEKGYVNKVSLNVLWESVRTKQVDHCFGPTFLSEQVQSVLSSLQVPSTRPIRWQVPLQKL